MTTKKAIFCVAIAVLLLLITYSSPYALENFHWTYRGNIAGHTGGLPLVYSDDIASIF